MGLRGVSAWCAIRRAASGMSACRFSLAESISANRPIARPLATSFSWTQNVMFSKDTHFMLLFSVDGGFMFSV